MQELESLFKREKNISLDWQMAKIPSTFFPAYQFMSASTAA